MTQRVAFKSTAMIAASKERSLVVSRKVKTDLDAPILMATNFKKPTPPPVAQFQPRVTTDLDNHFRGRAPAAAAQKRDELIAEARVYFAKDPKYLREHAATRGAR